MIQRPDFENACQSCGCEVPLGVAECARCTAYGLLAQAHDAAEKLREADEC